MATESSPSKMRYVTLLRRSGLAPAEYLLLMTIWTYSDEKMASAFPSVNQLAEDTGLSPRYVKTVRKKLEERGFLILKSRGGRRQGKPEASEYRLALPSQNPPQMGEPQITPSVEMGDPQIPSRVIHRSEMGEPQITPSDPDQINDQIHPRRDSPAPRPPRSESSSGEGFKEWINLFPSTKRRKVDDARAKYAETIESVDHSILVDSTRAYLDHEQQNEGGKYIGQALAVLEDRRWEKHKPKPDPNLQQITGLRLNRDRLHKPGSDEWHEYNQQIEEAEQNLIDRQGYIRDVDGILRKPELTPEQKKARADFLRMNPYLLNS
ncbi:helix-turn-helix domain-containing protein [Brachybacterium sp. J153]|uniref:helix-turn-helix domain-containing protein n=1 Tax=Brachybacterium sp. J153 TaxID=3116488 RepID=UPI002E76EB50|nr:helix-turn-helix domain-containing protein [Brachybacterium sp. J153]MEE1617319.1 helix-turn-helix domain-containing protein [Brachybacterium sp. J153]